MQHPMFCPNCGSANLKQQRDDWNDLTYDWCDCGFSNRPTFEEWAARLRRLFDAGHFDHDPDLHDFVGMELAELEDDTEWVHEVNEQARIVDKKTAELADAGIHPTAWAEILQPEIEKYARIARGIAKGGDE